MSETETDMTGAEGTSAIAEGSIKLVPQADQLKNPDARILLRAAGSSLTLIGELCVSHHGLTSGDLGRFILCFWELPAMGPRHRLYQSPPWRDGETSGREQVVVDLDGKEIRALAGFRPDGSGAWSKLGVAVSTVGDIRATWYLGDVFDQTCTALIPNSGDLLPALWAYANDPTFVGHVRAIDQCLKVTNKSFEKIPFDLAHWQRVAAEKYPNGLPEPQSDDSTQWLFHGHPGGNGQMAKGSNGHMGTVLQVAVARLVGYKWPAELDPKMRLAPEARAWVEKCKDLDSHADDDGVVPLVNINKERPGHERVRALLEAAFGDRWTPGLLNDLLAAAGAPGKSLDDWLKHDFFAQHCAVFHHRPFVWQIWDGKKDGFNILVHYHRLAEGDGKGHKLLQKITYTYLGDWITQQQAAAKRGEAGADTRLKAALELQERLEAILQGTTLSAVKRAKHSGLLAHKTNKDEEDLESEPPYDIFVRWKPLHEQPIGWNPDINDGVRVNIRPFVAAGVLRGKVNVKWTKDRGKEPESIRPKAQFPWFWSCPEDEPPLDFAGGAKFTGERLNDLHYTQRAKETARHAAASKAKS